MTSATSKESRWADGDHERLPKLVGDLIERQVDVIVAAATPASRAAKAATRVIPIVFVAVGEPVKAGLVKSFAHPGGNVTGLSLLTPPRLREGWRPDVLSAQIGQISIAAPLGTWGQNP